MREDAQPEGERRSSPLLLVVVAMIVLAGLAAFVVFRGNGGHPGAQPAAHPLPNSGASTQ